MEKNNQPRRRGLLKAGLVLGLLGLAGCADYEGSGDKFTLEGRVISTGERSVLIDPTQIIETHGDANNWFDIGNETRIHNNYRDDGPLSCDIQTVGEEYDVSGLPEDIEDLQPGEYVHVEGRIRDSHEGCGKGSSDEARPVYDSIQEVNK